MSNHQNKSLSLLEVIITLDSPTYNIINNLQTFKDHHDLSYSLHYGMTSLNHVYNKLSSSLMSNYQNNSLSLLEVIFTLDSLTYNIINQPSNP